MTVVAPQRLVFDRAGPVVMKSVDGLGDEKEFFKGKNRGLTRDGKYLLHVMPEKSPGNIEIQFVTLDGSKTPVNLPARLSGTWALTLSPDNRLLGYRDREEGDETIYLVTFPEFGNRTLVTHSRDLAMNWHPNGTNLLYLDCRSRAMMLLPVRRGVAIEVGQAVKLFDVPATCFDIDGAPHSFSISSDGKRFLMAQERRDDASKAAVHANTVLLVENWFEEFREKK